MSRYSLLTTTAIYPAVLYLSWDVIRTGKVKHVKVLRHVLWELRSSKRNIPVFAYQAFDLISGKYYPWAKSPEEATAFVLLAGAMS